MVMSKTNYCIHMAYGNKKNNAIHQKQGMIKYDSDSSNNNSLTAQNN